MARRKRKNDVVEMGVKALALGLGLLLAPLLVGASNPVLSPVTQALRTPAWISVAIGTVLLALHFLVGKKIVAPASLKRKRTDHRQEPRTATASRAAGRKSGGDMTEQRAHQAATDTPAPALPTEWNVRVFELIEPRFGGCMRLSVLR